MMEVGLKTLIVAAVLALSGCDQMAGADVNSVPKARAEAAIGGALTSRGAQFSGLPENNIAAVGPLAFKYQPSERSIEVSVLVAELTAWTLFPDRRPKIEKTVSALKDPSIGGRFQTDGATWALDRNTGKLTLGHTFPDSASAAELTKAAASLERIYPDWSLHWMGAVADIVHEGQPVPTQDVTVENNPYR